MAPCKSVILTEGLPWVKNIKSIKIKSIVRNLEEAEQIIKSNTELAQQRMKHHYDQGSAEAPYDVGVKVWVYTPKTRKDCRKN